jgi:hypothetical protein
MNSRHQFQCASRWLSVSIVRHRTSGSPSATTRSPASSRSRAAASSRRHPWHRASCGHRRDTDQEQMPTQLIRPLASQLQPPRFDSERFRSAPRTLCPSPGRLLMRQTALPARVRLLVSRSAGPSGREKSSAVLHLGATCRSVGDAGGDLGRRDCDRVSDQRRRAWRLARGTA